MVPLAVSESYKGAANGFIALNRYIWANKFLAATNEVIGSGYDLLPNYNSVFKFASSVESVFEIQATLFLEITKYLILNFLKFKV
jgi:hypothetical protein